MKQAPTPGHTSLTRGPDPGVGRPCFLRSAQVARATLAVCLLPGILVVAQDVTEPSLKAAFIFNFAKFTAWPADGATDAAPFVMCVYGDPAVGDALARTVKSHTLGGRTLAVTQLALSGPRASCNVLYVSRIAADKVAQLVAGNRDSPVLTISDVEGFTELGGITQFYFENGRLRFSVHLASAKRAGLQISSRLLALAAPQ